MAADHDLNAVSVGELKQAAKTLHLPTYGNKKDIAGRIAMCRGGDAVLAKLILTSDKMKEKTKAHSGFVNATKKLPDAVCKMRNLTLVKEDYSKPNPVFRYKIKLEEHKKDKKDHEKKEKKENKEKKEKKDSTPTKCVRQTTAGKRVAEALDDELADVEERVVARLMGKKVKREHINGMLEGYGLDVSSWPLAHAKEELVVQMLNESDEESDGEAN